MTGKTIAHYDILEKLGEGGMGVVYKARDKHLDRFVAIKVLPAEKVANVDRKARFVQEAKSASALNHPNIVTIHDIATENSIDFIAMEYVAGKTLDELIPRKGMRLGDALKITVQVADALAAAHEAGIIHRDLKPGNIIVGNDGRVRVLDFGLAKLSEVVPESDETRTVIAGEAPHTEEGTILGTASYMSPEQAEGKRLDARSDIFSFGSVLYEMVTGRRPFVGDSSMSTLAAIINKDAEALPQDVPHELQKLITRCLRKDLARRAQHMADVKLALEELKEESESGSLTGPAVVVEKNKPSVLLITAVAVVLVAAVASGYWFSRRGSGPTESAPNMQPLTTETGFEWAPSFSPDGNEIVFERDGDIYRKLIGASGDLRLTANPAWEGTPTWSPDGRQIAFSRRTEEDITVVLIPAIGGAERILYRTNVADLAVGPLSRKRMACWSADGRWIVAAGLVAIAVETGEVRPLTGGGDWLDDSPAVSPDGRSIAFVRQINTIKSEIYVTGVTAEMKPDGAVRQVTDLGRISCQPAWSSDGRDILFATGLSVGLPNLWRVSTSGGDPRPVSAFGGGGTWPAVSRQGDRMVFSKVDSRSDVWRVPLATSGEAAGEATPIINSTRTDYSQSYSPDGSRIAFMSDRSGQTAVWVCDEDGMNAREVYSNDGANCGSPRWSPDGSKLAFDLSVDDQMDIAVVAVDGGPPARITESPSADIVPSWSKDGESINFSSDRSGDWQIWKVASSGGQATQVTTAGGMLPTVSADGNTIYFQKGRAVWRMSAEGGDVSKVVGPIYLYAWGISERGIYFVPASEDGADSVIELFDFESKRRRRIVELTQPPGWSGLAVSPDGKYLTYPLFREQGSDLMLVENFR